jgi:GntR family transcriptional regulator
MAVQRRRVSEDLGDKILDAGVVAMRSGRNFPGESTLVDMFNVSRPALREALARLEAAGLIYRRQGAATVLNEAALALAGRFDQFGEFSEVITEAGMEPKLELIEAQIMPWSQERHGLFRSPPEFVMRSVKRWLADGVPVRVAEDLVPLPMGSELSAIDTGQSVLKIVAGLFDDEVTWEIAVPTAVLATAEVARWLNVRRGSPLLKLQTIGVTAGGVEAFRSNDYHVPGLVPQGFIRVVR